MATPRRSYDLVPELWTVKVTDNRPGLDDRYRIGWYGPYATRGAARAAAAPYLPGAARWWLTSDRYTVEFYRTATDWQKIDNDEENLES